MTETITTYYRLGCFATTDKAEAIELATKGKQSRIDWIDHTGDFFNRPNLIAEGIIIPRNNWERTREHTYYDRANER